MRCSDRFGRPRGGAAGKGDLAAVRYAETAAGRVPVEPAARKAGRGDAHSPVEADARDFRLAMIVILRIDAASVGRPLDRVDAIIPIGGQAALAQSFAVLNVDLLVLTTRQASVRKSGGGYL